MEATMQAAVRTRFGGPDVLAMQTVARPQPRSGEVLIRVRAFGLNRAEQYFREGLWGEVANISGIECVGEVVVDAAARLTRGQMVLALMGGMGRSIAGSYAEYVSVPRANVVPVQSSLGWAQLAALPESYATAWACLFHNLELRAGQLLWLRGAGSSLGRAALNLARRHGVRVWASVRHPAKADDLLAAGAEQVLSDAEAARIIGSQYPDGVDAVLDLVGYSSVLESLRHVRRGGRVCMAGFLGGGQALPGFDMMRDLPSGVQLSFFASALVFGSDRFPLTDIPFQHIIDEVAAGAFDAAPAVIMPFSELIEAHRLLDAQTTRGKIVIVHPD